MAPVVFLEIFLKEGHLFVGSKGLCGFCLVGEVRGGRGRQHVFFRFGPCGFEALLIGHTGNRIAPKSLAVICFEACRKRNREHKKGTSGRGRGINGQTGSNSMNKAMKSIGLCLLLLMGATAGLKGESFRTDINPALRYYQALILAPDLSQQDRDFLFNKEWRGQKLPEKFGELVTMYNHEFTQVRQAASATVPCDWGIDMTPGPATLLPQLARLKGIAQAARLRAMWNLQQGNARDAGADLQAAFVLARNSSRDGTLIAALVQIAMENIIYNTVAENFYQFPPETLKQLVAGFDAAPARAMVAGCIPTEKAFFHDWLVAKIGQLQKDYRGEETKVMEGIRELVTGVDGGEEGQTGPGHLWEQVSGAAGGTSQGVVKLLHEAEAFYTRAATILALPRPQYEEQMRLFGTEIRKSANPLVSQLFPAWEKCRTKEFTSLVGQEMVRAATEYKLHGEEGVKKVMDPSGDGPFTFERFVFGGVERGFKLKSADNGRGVQEALIFVEKEGPAFQVGGKNAGKPVAPPAAK